jgi:hypothetical protein
MNDIWHLFLSTIGFASVVLLVVFSVAGYYFYWVCRVRKDSYLDYIHKRKLDKGGKSHDQTDQRTD